MALILANYSASVYRTDEGRDHPSLPEPSAIMSAPHFTPAALHKELCTLDRRLIDEGHKVELVDIGFTKVVDSVNHRYLQAKLKPSGIDGAVRN